MVCGRSDCSVVFFVDKCNDEFALVFVRQQTTMTTSMPTKGNVRPCAVMAAAAVYRHVRW